MIEGVVHHCTEMEIDRQYVDSHGHSTVAFAFSKANMFEARLQPVFSSDISHWDVEEMNGVVDEAHGLQVDERRQQLLPGRARVAGRLQHHELSLPHDLADRGPGGVQVG